MIHLKKLVERSAPTVIPPSRWDRLGKNSARANVKWKLLVVSDEEIRKRKTHVEVRSVYGEKSDAPMQIITSRNNWKVKNAEDHSSRFHKKAPMSRVFSESLRPTMVENIY